MACRVTQRLWARRVFLFPALGALASLTLTGCIPPLSQQDLNIVNFERAASAGENQLTWDGCSFLWAHHHAQEMANADRLFEPDLNWSPPGMPGGIFRCGGKAAAANSGEFLGILLDPQAMNAAYIHDPGHFINIFNGHDVTFSSDWACNGAHCFQSEIFMQWWPP